MGPNIKAYTEKSDSFGIPARTQIPKVLSLKQGKPTGAHSLGGRHTYPTNTIGSRQDRLGKAGKLGLASAR